MMNFSENLKKYRIEAGFDQAKKFANITGVSVFVAYVCYEQYRYTREYKHWLKHRYDKQSAIFKNA